ncbi:sterol O-acyltransferase 2-like [Scleropages formosus]|uniref:O-acyltransferase n=1 Tax=Scleropages formosus TaxID=113540 RepID=A0A0P7Y2S6_SCLFO|nr:sterol O-acyltransferase 2-like [Scleropages formosus]
MATPSKDNRAHHRNKAASSSPPGSNNEPKGPEGDRAELAADDLIQWKRHIEVLCDGCTVQQVKAELLEQIQGVLGDLLDKAIKESVQSYSSHSRVLPDRVANAAKTNRDHRMEDGKVFMARRSVLDELFEINHIRTIYHMFIAALMVFIISTLAVDYIDQGRLVLEFDLLFYAFGKLPTVLWAWLIMFSYTLAGPYHALTLWGGLYHSSSVPGVLSLGVTLLLGALQACVLGVFPIYVVVRYQLPPASRFIIILEQHRLTEHSYSPGEAPKFPTFSSYLYFLFCPTLIYRESYPRWNYVAVTFAKILGCLFYAYFVLVRLCIPALMNESIQPFSTRTLVLALFHATLPGMLILLLAFFAFLHCWLNAFAEMLRFADRMFYKDWWNSTSFANYYRTWNVVVHDWLYYYGYRDFLWVPFRSGPVAPVPDGEQLIAKADKDSQMKGVFRTAAMLSVFIVSAMVHEYVFTLCFGFFYPVMFCLFAVFGVVFNFTMNDKRKSPVWNIIMWTCLFIGQGVQVCLYCQEWHAQIHCPRTGVGTAR